MQAYNTEKNKCRPEINPCAIPWRPGTKRNPVVAFVLGGAQKIYTAIDVACRAPASLGAWSDENCGSTQTDNWAKENAYAEGDAYELGQVFGDGLVLVLGGPKSASPGARLVVCHSFLPDTLVLMADGSQKRIADIVPGDVVLATDPETGKTGPQTVLASITTEDDKLFSEITVATETGSQVITATQNHPFWIADLNRWLDAGKIQPGQWLRTEVGSWVQVSGNRKYNRQQRTNDLTIARAHTYYVLAGATPVLVHNNDASFAPQKPQRRTPRSALKRLQLPDSLTTETACQEISISG
ncbi:polymorphic toxin-type HINT domain-containing protein [Streptodolium elevatio]|uniref:Polymorphic toxin-type HINT domain-containing protein n=1 Tax=Streptodolium elevatio TaxID=3157996 RepID=A0ABV3DW53_9ACTN